MKQPLRIVPGDWPLILGLSHGDGVAATVVAQSYGNEIRVLAAFCTEGMSLRQHLEETRAWLAANVPYRLQLMGGYEDNPNVDIRAATYGPAQEVLNGQWAVVTRAWEARLDEMRSALVKAQPYTFKPAVQISPLSTAPLAQALGRGRYFEKSEKKSYHVVNAFTLLLTRLELWKATPKNPRPMRLPPSAMSA